MASLGDLYEQLVGKAHCVAIIGGGGKTSLMYALCREGQKHGRVIVTTSTKIAKPMHIPYAEKVERPLLYSEALCIASTEAGKLRKPEQDFEELMTYCDLLLIEADGSKGLPLKVHAEHEPVIPSCAEQVLAVVGMSALGERIANVAHRPQHCASLLGVDEEHRLGITDVLKVLSLYPPITGLILNQCDDDLCLDLARRIAELVELPVAITRLQRNNPIREIWRNGTCLYS